MIFCFFTDIPTLIKFPKGTYFLQLHNIKFLSKLLIQ